MCSSSRSAGGRSCLGKCGVNSGRFFMPWLDRRSAIVKHTARLFLTRLRHCVSPLGAHRTAWARNALNLGTNCDRAVSAAPPSALATQKFDRNGLPPEDLTLAIGNTAVLSSLRDRTGEHELANFGIVPGLESWTLRRRLRSCAVPEDSPEDPDEAGPRTSCTRLLLQWRCSAPLAFPRIRVGHLDAIKGKFNLTSSAIRVLTRERRKAPCRGRGFSEAVSTRTSPQVVSLKHVGSSTLAENLDKRDTHGRRRRMVALDSARQGHQGQDPKYHECPVQSRNPLGLRTEQPNCGSRARLWCAAECETPTHPGCVGRGRVSAPPRRAGTAWEGPGMGEHDDRAAEGRAGWIEIVRCELWEADHQLASLRCRSEGRQGQDGGIEKADSHWPVRGWRSTCLVPHHKIREAGPLCLRYGRCTRWQEAWRAAAVAGESNAIPHSTGSKRGRGYVKISGGIRFGIPTRHCCMPMGKT